MSKKAPQPPPNHPQHPSTTQKAGDKSMATNAKGSVNNDASFFEFVENFVRQVRPMIKSAEDLITTVPQLISRTSEENGLERNQTDLQRLLQLHYDKLINYITNTNDIVSKLYADNVFTFRELEAVQQERRLTRKNELLLNFVQKKSSSTYDNFLDALRASGQYHVYFLLLRQESFGMKHTADIQRYFVSLMEDIELESNLLSLLMSNEVITYRELEEIKAEKNPHEQNAKLLCLMSMKSSGDYDKFLEALCLSNQRHIFERLTCWEKTTQQKELPIEKENELLRLVPGRRSQERRSSVMSRHGADSTSSDGGGAVPMRPIPCATKTKPGIPPKKPKLCPGEPRTVNQKDSLPQSAVRRYKKRNLDYQRLPDIILIAISVKVLGRLLQGHFPNPTDQMNLLKSLVTTIEETRRQAMESREKAKNLQEMAANAEKQGVEAKRQIDRERERYKALELHIKDLREDVQKVAGERDKYKDDCRLLADKTAKLTTKLEMAQRDAGQLKEENSRSKTEAVGKAEEHSRNLKLESETREVLEIAMAKIKKEKEAVDKENERLENQLKSAEEERDLIQAENDRLKSSEQDMAEQMLHLKTLNETLKKKLNDVEVQKSLLETRLNALTRRQISKSESTKEDSDMTPSSSETSAEQQATVNEPVADEDRDDDLSENEILTLRNNHTFLVENLDSNELVDRLFSANCITETFRQYIINQDNEFDKNDELLHWMKRAGYSHYKTVGQTLRQTNQALLADILDKGGVMVKSKIINKNTGSLRVKEEEMVDKLNNTFVRRSSSVSSSPSPQASDKVIKLVSEFKDQKIEIVDRSCLQDKGIVMWFWCRSQTALQKLQEWYSQDSLREKMKHLFKAVSTSNGAKGGILSKSEPLQPETISMYSEEFNKSFPPSIHIRSTKKLSMDGYSVRGIAALEDQIFVILNLFSAISVYKDTEPFKHSRDITITELKDPWDLAACPKNQMLYVSDRSTKCVWSSDAKGRFPARKWLTSVEEPFTLSVTAHAQVVMVEWPSSLKIYSKDGVEERVIPLPEDFVEPTHAVQTRKGTFIVGHGGRVSKIHRICELTKDGIVLRTFGGQKGQGLDQLYSPVHLYVDDFMVLIADEGNDRLVRLNTRFSPTDEPIIIREKVYKPFRLNCMGDTTNILVGQYGAMDVFSRRQGSTVTLASRTSTSSLTHLRT